MIIQGMRLGEFIRTGGSFLECVCRYCPGFIMCGGEKGTECYLKAERMAGRPVVDPKPKVAEKVESPPVEDQGSLMKGMMQGFEFSMMLQRRTLRAIIEDKKLNEGERMARMIQFLVTLAGEG